MSEKIKRAKLSDLTPDNRNANAGTERGTYMLDYSVRTLGAGRGILIDKENRIIAGNKTVEALGAVGLEDVIIVETDGTKIVATKRTDLDLITDEEARLMAYADNRVSEVGFSLDLEELQIDIGEGLDLSGLFTDFEIEAFSLDDSEGASGEQQTEARQTLAERFIVPPFSVLNARQGYWQDRKRAWLALGIESEIGRGENLGNMSAAVAGITDPDAVAEWNKTRRALIKKGEHKVE